MKILFLAADFFRFCLPKVKQYRIRVVTISYSPISNYIIYAETLPLKTKIKKSV